MPVCAFLCVVCVLLVLCVFIAWLYDVRHMLRLRPVGFLWVSKHVFLVFLCISPDTMVVALLTVLVAWSIWSTVSGGNAGFSACAQYYIAFWYILVIGSSYDDRLIEKDTLVEENRKTRSF